MNMVILGFFLIREITEIEMSYELVYSIITIDDGPHTPLKVTPFNLLSDTPIRSV